MKLSADPNYLAFGSAIASGDLASAEVAIRNCLKSELASDPGIKSFLLQRLAEIRFNLGNNDESFQIFQQSEAADPTSPQPSYFYARFLLEQAQKPEHANKKITEVLHRIRAGDYTFTDTNDWPKEKYIEKLTQLLELSINQMPS